MGANGGTGFGFSGFGGGGVGRVQSESGAGCGWVRAPLGRLGGSLVMQGVGKGEGLGDDK